MKNIAFINWCLIASYTVFLLGFSILAGFSSSNDRAAGGYAIVLFIPLGILGLLNLVPLLPVRIIVFGGCMVPLIGGFLMLVVKPIKEHFEDAGSLREEKARADGSYYFKDAQRQIIAQYIAAQDLDKLRSALAEPVPYLNSAGQDNVTLFEFATMQKDKYSTAQLIKCFEVLLEMGAQIDNGDRDHTPTHFRVLPDDPELLEWFLDHGADPNARDPESQFPLLYALIVQQSYNTTTIPKVRCLLAHGADPNLVAPASAGDLKGSLLLTAFDKDYWEITHMLLDAGADTSYQTRSGWNIHTAIVATEKVFREWGKEPDHEFVKLAQAVRKTGGKRED